MAKKAATKKATVAEKHPKDELRALVTQAMDAIDNVFGFTKVSKDETLKVMTEIADETFAKCKCLEDELGNEDG